MKKLLLLPLLSLSLDVSSRVKVSLPEETVFDRAAKQCRLIVLDEANDRKRDKFRKVFTAVLGLVEAGAVYYLHREYCKSSKPEINSYTSTLGGLMLAGLFGAGVSCMFYYSSEHGYCDSTVTEGDKQLLNIILQSDPEDYVRDMRKLYGYAPDFMKKAEDGFKRLVKSLDYLDMLLTVSDLYQDAAYDDLRKEVRRNYEAVISAHRYVRKNVICG